MCITHVKAHKLNQAHSRCSVVFGNLISMIKPSTKRADLLPVYSFNSPGISLTKSGALGNRVGGSERSDSWNWA